MMVHKMMRQWKKGFSLAEVLVVVAIMAILASVSAPAIIKMRDQLRQTELDAKAQEIFVVAQNQLLGLKASGTSVVEGATKLTSYDPDDYSEDGASSMPDEIKEDMYYVVADQNSSFTWMNNTMFAPSMMEDGEMYAIEFNAKSYVVYSVFYKRKTDTFQKTSNFQYSDLTNEYNNYLGKEIRKSKENRDALVGYYGGNTISSVEEPKNMEFDAHIENGNELLLVIEPSAELWNNTTFRVEISSVTDPNATVCTYIIPDKSSNERVTFDQGTHEYTMTLDSLKLGLHFTTLCPDIVAGDDIEVKVIGSYSGKNAIYKPKIVSRRTNSLFGQTRNSGNGSTVKIENGRHLQNLSYEVSKLGYNGSGVQTSKPVSKAVLLKDIDWSDFDSETTIDWDNKDSLNDTTDCLSTWDGKKGIHFYPISNYQTSLTEFDGNGYEISNIIITESKYNTSGLFGYLVAGFRIKNTNIVNPIIWVSNVASVGTLVGNCEQIDVQNCGVYLKIKDTTEQIADLYEKNKLVVENKSTLTGSNIGGLIGNAFYSEISKSFSSIKIEAKTTSMSLMCVGGLIGSTHYYTDIVECYSGGHTENGVYKVESPNILVESSSECRVGGLVGFFDVNCKIDKSYSTCSVKAARAGRLVGKQDSVSVGTIKNSYSMWGEDYADDGTTVLNDGCTEDIESLLKVEDAKKLNSDSSTTFAYDATYLTPEKTAFPGVSWTGTHYGDWPDKKNITTDGLVYYEKYDLGNGKSRYGLWSVDADENAQFVANGVGLDEENEYDIIVDGYGYLADAGTDDYRVRFGSNDYNNGNTWMNSAIIETIGNKRLFFITWTQMHDKESGEGKNKNFYRKISIWDKGTGYQYYVNMDFAKAIYSGKAEPIQTDHPQNIIIRTARHLYELSTSGGMANVTGSRKNLYWSEFGDFKQEHDIDYSKYLGGSELTNYGNQVSSGQGMIGTCENGQDRSFNKVYDGGMYKIKNLILHTAVDGFVSIFGNSTGEIKNLNIEDLSIIPWNTASVSGVVVENNGTMSNVNLINPSINTNENTNFNASGFVYTNRGSITNCYVYPKQEDGSFLHIYSGEKVIKNNYMNAMVTGGCAAGFAFENGSDGTIKNSAVIASVNSGQSSSKGNASGFQSLKMDAAGFVRTNEGVIVNCYSNCYTAGSIASGFAHTNSGTISGSYALRRVTTTGALDNAARIASGFVYQNEGLIKGSYTASSLYNSENYGINNYCYGDYVVFNSSIPPLPQYYAGTLNLNDGLYAFAAIGTVDDTCGYLSFGDNSIKDESGAKPYAFEAMSTFTAEGLSASAADGSDTEAFSKDRTTPYPFPKVSGMIQYGDWPIAPNGQIDVQMVYYEIYKDGNNYTVGMYNDALNIRTLKEDASHEGKIQVYMDGYALLFDKSSFSSTDIDSLLENGKGNDNAYVQWYDLLENNDNNSTKADNGVPLFKVSDLRNQNNQEIANNTKFIVNNAQGAKVESSENGTVSINYNGTIKDCYFRMLPAAAVMTNAYTNDSTCYQDIKLFLKLSIGKDEGTGKESSERVQNDKEIYYCPYFAKSKIFIGEPPEKESEPSEFYIRSVRQLCSLGVDNMPNGDTNSYWYSPDRRFKQELDIIFTDSDKQEIYSKYYGRDSSGNILELTNNSNRKYGNYRKIKCGIGNSDKPFSGIYSGELYAIRGIDDATSSVFGYISNAQIHKLTLKDSTFSLSGDSGNGALCNRALNSKFDQLVIHTVEVESTKYAVSSLVGIIETTGDSKSSANIENCKTNDTILLTTKNGTDSIYRSSIGTLAGVVKGNVSIKSCEVNNPQIEIGGDGNLGCAGGAIGYYDGTQIKDLLIKNPYIHMTNGAGFGRAVGGAIGYYKGGQTINAKVYKQDSGNKTVKIEASDGTGGFIGWLNANDTDTIEQVTVEDIEVTGSQAVGGFVGVMNAGAITKSNAYAAVTEADENDKTNRFFGGFVGCITVDKAIDKASEEDGPSAEIKISSAQIKECYASGNVMTLKVGYDSKKRIGGFVGAVKSVRNIVTQSCIKSCYSSGNVIFDGSGVENKQKHSIGGFCGIISISENDNFTIEENYSVGEVINAYDNNKTISDKTRIYDIGGFAGESGISLTKCYYLQEDGVGIITNNRKIPAYNSVYDSSETKGIAWTVQQRAFHFHDSFESELDYENSGSGNLIQMKPSKEQIKITLSWPWNGSQGKTYPYPTLYNVGYRNVTTNSVYEDIGYSHMPTGLAGTWCEEKHGRVYYPIWNR